MDGKRRRGGTWKQRLPVPPGFEENATEFRNAELMKLYGVSRVVVTRWRRETGVPGKLGGAKFCHATNDSPEEIAACLTCPALGCTHGDCERRKRIAALAGGGST
ncbi:MAG: hypothetical protein IJR48_04100 [Oscillibacter sp.]|nr:hypothetical protein [Oscillibacter sp.]MBQ9617526.1 hypothetical protein [Oscillibacter sp.]